MVLRAFYSPHGHIATTVKITAIGNSAGVILPKELLKKLRVSKGATLTVTETPDGLNLNP